jgi:8-oxo-dGTP pyrophosphatase MutT (NUDIX family)
MAREISAGGVVVRWMGNAWEIAAIQPRKDASEPAVPAQKPKKAPKVVLALPKGLLDPGEKPEQTAIREVAEETGLSSSVITKLGDIKYQYVRSWGDQERVFKVVSFYLLKYESGEIDAIDPAMRVEVIQACWIPLETAAKQLAYRGDKEMVRKAQAYLESHNLEPENKGSHEQKEDEE